MTKRVFIPGLSALCACAMIGSVAATATAQQTPVRLVQASDGTMYVVQGSNSWTLVPDQISDSDMAALNPSGEIDGTLPTELLIVRAPTAPIVQAPAAPVVAPTPMPPAPAPIAGPTPITGTVNLTGKVANDLPGTLIAIGTTVTSVIDNSTKPNDVYAIALSAGASYQALFSSTNHFGTSGVIMPGLVNPNGNPSGNTHMLGAGGTLEFTAATSDTYYVRVSNPFGSGAQYTMTVKQRS